jgi:hypothetical protein
MKAQNHQSEQPLESRVKAGCQYFETVRSAGLEINSRPRNVTWTSSVRGKWRMVSLSRVGNFPFPDRYTPRLASDLPLFIYFRQFLIAVSDLRMQLVSGDYGANLGARDDILIMVLVGSTVHGPCVNDVLRICT